MSIAYELWHEENVVRLYDDYFCPVMSDDDPKAFIEMQPIDLTSKPTNVEEEVTLLNRIFQQALEQNEEIACIMIGNLGVSRCGFSIRGDEDEYRQHLRWHNFSYEAFQKWRDVNDLTMDRNQLIYVKKFLEIWKLATKLASSRQDDPTSEETREEIKELAQELTFRYPQPVTGEPNFSSISHDELHAALDKGARIMREVDPVTISENYQRIGRRWSFTVDELPSTSRNTKDGESQ